VVFGINDLKIADASSFDPHRAWGSILMVISLVMLIVALIAWQSRRTTISAFLLALLTVIAQNVLAALGDSNKWVGGLHALDGMLILLLSLWIAVLGWRRQRAR
jgi:heme A synthase